MKEEDIFLFLEEKHREMENQIAEDFKYILRRLKEHEINNSLNNVHPEVFKKLSYIKKNKLKANAVLSMIQFAQDKLVEEKK